MSKENTQFFKVNYSFHWNRLVLPTVKTSLCFGPDSEPEENIHYIALKEPIYRAWNQKTPPALMTTTVLLEICKQQQIRLRV